MQQSQHFAASDVATADDLWPLYYMVVDRKGNPLDGPFKTEGEAFRRYSTLEAAGYRAVEIWTAKQWREWVA